ncbi:50S ribosomal protein L18 [Bienertia sinuspersici]
MGITRDVAAASKIGKILGERLLIKNIPAVSIFLKREQKYHGKIKAVVDSMRDAGKSTCSWQEEEGGCSVWVVSSVGRVVWGHYGLSSISHHHQLSKSNVYTYVSFIRVGRQKKKSTLASPQGEGPGKGPATRV